MLDARVAAGSRILSEPNAIGAALGLLGDEWTLLIARGAFQGAHRYGDWKAQLAISDAVLSARLAALVEAGVLRREAGDVPNRQAYALTAAGVDLWPVLLCIWDWERRHAAGQSALLPTMVHSVCGAAFHPVLRCGRCRRPADAADVAARFGPSGGFERSMPVGSNRRRNAAVRSAAGPGLFAETMEIIGNRWSAGVLGAMFLGATRFRDIEQIGAPPAIVADRLRRFVDLGVIAPTGSDAGEPNAYRLTAKGEALFPVVVSFLGWGERWRPAADGPAVESTHLACGGAFVPELSCSACTGALSLVDVRIVSRSARALPGRPLHATARAPG